MKFKIAFLAGSLCVASLTSRPALAQWNAYDSLMSNNSFSRGWVNPYDNTFTNAYKWMTPTTNYYGTYFSGSSSSRASRRQARLKAMPRRQKTEMQRFARFNGTMYKPSKSVNTANEVAQMFASNLGGTASQFSPVMRELWGVYVQRAKSQNAPPTDLARTMAYCIAGNYYYFTGGTGVPESQIAILRGKLREALNENPKFRALTNAQKQKMNESMVMLTHFSALGFEEIAPKLEADKRAQAREGFKALAGINLKGILGVAPDRVSFDKDGLVIASA